jgi:hypothetical protein
MGISFHAHWAAPVRVFAFDVGRLTASRRRRFGQIPADAFGLPLNEKLAPSNHIRAIWFGSRAG